MPSKSYPGAVLLALITLFFAPDPAAAGDQAMNLTEMLSANAAARASAISGPIIFVIPGTSDFGCVNVGASAILYLTVENRGNGALNVSNAIVFDPVYTVGPIPLDIAAGASVVVPVTFSPQDGLEHPATVDFLSDAVNGTVTAGLTGRGNAAPRLEPISDQLVPACTNLSFVLSASDDEDTNDDVLTFSMSPGLPSDAEFDTATGAFSWTPTSGDAGVYAVEFCVSDFCAPASSLTDCQTIQLTVVTVPEPSCTIGGEATVCVASTGLVYTVSSPVSGAAFTWSIEGSGTIQSVSDDGSSATVNAGGLGTFTLSVLSEKDGCASNCEYVVSVEGCRENCPRTDGFWKNQAAQVGSGNVKFTAAEVTQVAECVDNRVAIFNWASGSDLSSFLATVDPPTPPPTKPQRQNAKKQFATFLANVCTGSLGLVASNGDLISLDLSTPVSCNGTTPTTLGDLIGAFDARFIALEGQPLTDPSVKEEYSAMNTCLTMINEARGIGTVCPAVEPVDGGGIGLAGGVVGRLFDELPAPNPFTQSTHFVLAVRGARSETADVRVFDVAGRLVRTIATGSLTPGQHEMAWDGHGEQGKRMPSGVYFLQTTVGVDKAVIRLLYLR